MFQQIHFSFAKSFLATNAPPIPDSDAILHLLPPQPISLKSSQTNRYSKIVTVPVENNKNNFVDFTLGNSPEYSNPIEPQKNSQAISNFNQKQAQSSKKFTNKFNQTQKQTKQILGNRPQSKSKDLATSKNQLLAPPKQTHFIRSTDDSKTQRQEYSKGSRAINNSNVRDSNVHNQSTTRNPREDSIYLGDKVKKKFTTKAQITKNASPEKLSLITKVQEQKVRIQQNQALNKTLGTQLQMCREKLKIKQSQNIALKDQFGRVYQQCKKNQIIWRQLQRQLIQQKKMNDYFCDQIDKQKDEVVRYELKNEQSLRLLQKLNENITKRQQKLQKQLTEQIASYNKLMAEYNSLDQKIKTFIDQIQTLKQKSVQSQQKASAQTLNKEKVQMEISQKYQQLSNLKKQYFDTANDLRVYKDENKLLKDSLSESNHHKQKLLIELGKYQEQISSLKTSKQELTRQLQDQQRQYQHKINQLIESDEQKISQLKHKIEEYDNRIQTLFYQNKEYEMKLEVSNESNQQYMLQLKDIKDEKKTLYLQKQQLKNDVTQLLIKNDQLFSNLQFNKRKEIQLNNTISQQQKELIALEQRISENIEEIGNKDIEISQLRKQLQEEKKYRFECVSSNDQKQVRIRQLEDRLKKFQKMLSIYKDEINKMKNNKEVQWQEMKAVYEDQILILQERLKEFTQSKEYKKAVKNTQRKIIKNEIIQEEKSIITLRKVSMHESGDLRNSQIEDQKNSITS